MSIWHGFSSVAEGVQFVPFPNMLLHLISRMPCRHNGWKACNGFMYRLHVGFPCSHSVELCRQLFLMFRFCNLFHVSKKADACLRWCSTWAPMMWQQGKTFPIYLKEATVCHFTNGNGWRVYTVTRVTHIHINKEPQLLLFIWKILQWIVT